jgi:branched-chain amino acid transport system substrate-binding protein
MYPLTGPNAAPGEMEAIELGQRDFADILGHVSGTHARPIGVVACDDSTQPLRAAKHLVDDVRVPAVLGFNTSEEVLQLAPEVFLPHGTLVMSTLNSSPLIASIPQAKGTLRLVWRTMFTSKQTAAPMSALISNVIEPRVRKAPGGLGATAPMRVAFVRTRITTELALSDALLRTLRFNDKSALENGTNFREIVVDDPTIPGAKPDFRPAIEDLIKFEPTVIILWSGTGFIERMMAPLESEWPKGAARRPTYAFASPPAVSLYPVVGSNAELRRRIFALTNVSTTPANARLVTHFNEAFADKVTRTASPNSSYDGFYVVAYAAYAVGDKPVTGDALSSTIARLLPPGIPIEVGPLGILDGFNALANGGRIDLDGAIGPLDFDLSSGEAAIDMAVLCVDVDKNGVANDTVESGLVYRTRTAKLEGELRCP